MVGHQQNRNVEGLQPRGGEGSRTTAGFVRILDGLNSLVAGLNAAGSPCCLSPCSHRAENLLGCRHVPGLLFGEDQFAIGKHVQHAAPAQAQLDFLHSGLLLQFALQAPGLTANVGSKKTALDVNSHGSPPFAIRCWCFVR